ncbi:hypothetical protein LOC67_15895 [Stieleria sp. JC731]|uniref:tetratricopeptide repeat protein n=1 Tax=Stieleria sp. JC731 TaxID=2894195 RepID=UPI001E2D034D|nr:tetratricopeptide repeat protein [Stieleria sp. JC731]MCC9602045.1 hypothetical protein [Stieleria sp. JC731]
MNCETNIHQTGLLLVFRAEIVWITVFLAVGAIGGLVYNWPESVDDSVVQSVDASADASSELAAEDTEIDDTWPFEDDVRENPQSQADPVSEAEAPLPTDPSNEAVDDVFSQISPPMKRNQSVDWTVVDLGDRLLMGGNFDGAYTQYERLWKASNVPTDKVVLMRLALAAELAQRHDDAIKHYRSAIRVAEKGSIAQANCLLGIARVWENRGSFEDSNSLLSELFLLYTSDQFPKLLRGQLMAQLSDCLQKRLLSNDLVIDALQKDPMEYFWPALVIEDILQLIDSDMPADGSATSPSQLQILQAPQLDASVIIVAANVRGLSVLGLLGEVEKRVEAQQGGGSASDLTGELDDQANKLRFTLTERAKSDLVGRMTNIQTGSMPLTYLLDCVLEPMQLSWSQAGSEITIMHRDEMAPRDLASFDLARTQRMLRQLQFENLEGPRQTAAIMNEGNNARLSGGWDVARDQYKKAREKAPSNELSAKLYFNEASLQLADGQKLDALNACYMALDQTLTASLQGDAYAMIAELELELGQTEKSITAGARGLRRATEPEVLSRCAMILSRAYLLNDDPDSANQVLFNQSQHIIGESQRRVASVFSTFARFQRNPSRGGLQDEGQRLVRALATLKPGDPDGFADALIVSQAYASVGIRNRAIESLREAVASAPQGFWAERIRLELAKTLYEAGSLQEADEAINGFGQVSIDLLPQVLLLHAKVKFDSNQLDQCESICRRIIRMNVDKAIQTEALNKLGMVLNEKGQHYAATLCFAGYLPESVDNQPATDTQGVVIP